MKSRFSSRRNFLDFFICMNSSNCVSSVFADINRIWRSNLQSLVSRIPSPSLIWTPSRTKEFLTSTSWTPKSSTTTCETRRLRLPPACTRNGRSARCYSTLYENLNTSESAAFIELSSLGNRDCFVFVCLVLSSYDVKLDDVFFFFFGE